MEIIGVILVLLVIGLVANVAWTIMMKVMVEKPLELIASFDRKVCPNCGFKNKPLASKVPPPSSHFESFPEKPQTFYSRACEKCGGKLKGKTGLEA